MSSKYVDVQDCKDSESLDADFEDSESLDADFEDSESLVSDFEDSESLVSDFEDSESLISWSEDYSAQDTSNDDLDGLVVDEDLGTWEKVEHYINSNFAIVKNEDPNTCDLSKPIQNLKMLCKSLKSRKNTYFVKMANYMVTLEIMETLVRFLEIGVLTKANLQSLSHKNLNSLLLLVASLLDGVSHVCFSAHSNGLHRKILEKLEGDLRDLIEGEQNLEPMVQVKHLFGILYQMIGPFSLSESEICRVKEVCLRYLDIENLYVQAVAILVLTSTFGREESMQSIKLTAPFASIPILIGFLNEALSSPDRQDANGFNVEQLLRSLTMLAANEANSLEMTRVGLHQQCMLLLDKNYSVWEVQVALNLVWCLCFYEENRDAIKYSGIKPLLEKLMQQDEGDGTELAEKILKQLEVKKPDLTSNVSEPGQSTELANENSVDGHIMISYCWKQKQKVRQIHERLKASEKKVWIDFEQMHGDVSDRMAEAVQNAAVIICCMSKDYNNSRACQKEATYADKLDKKIIFVKMQDFDLDGWLELILGTHYYYDLSDEDNFVEKLMEMIVHLESICDVTET